MIIKSIPYESKHLQWLFTSGNLEPHVDISSLDFSRSLPGCVSFVGEGKVWLVGGVATYWPYRGELWAIFNRNAGDHFFQLHRLTQEYLKTLPHRRLEFAVSINHEKGHKWARMLKFEEETKRVRAYFPNGEDATMYVRIKP